jgi:hypothetical protein
MQPDQNHRFYAFISYRHTEPDRRWAKWLHSAVETYRVPQKLRKERNFPPRVRPIFRDEEELPASSNLSEEIEEALKESRSLVIVCSPRTPESKWVNKEIVLFREIGRGSHILSLLIEGNPHEAFPQALREIRRHIADRQAHNSEEIDAIEPLAADVRPKANESSRHLKRMAKLRIIAGILGCEFDDLRQRDRERRIRNYILTVLASVALLAIVSALSYYALNQRNQSIRNDIDAKLAKDANLKHSPLDMERWHHLSDLLNTARSIGYKEAAEQIQKRLRCLPGPAARDELLTSDPLRLSVELNADGSRLCVAYSDRIEILDAHTRERLFTKGLGADRPARQVLMRTDPYSDNVIYVVRHDNKTDIDADEFEGEIFITAFDGSPPKRLVFDSEFLSTIIKYTRGNDLLRLRLIIAQAIASGQVAGYQNMAQQLSELKDKLNLKAGSGLWSLVYYSQSNTGVYLVFTAEDAQRSLNGIAMIRAKYYPIFYDGKDTVITLIAPKKTGPFIVTSLVLKFRFDMWNSRPIAYDARRKTILFGYRFVKIVDDGQVESSDLDLVSGNSDVGDLFFIEPGLVGIYYTDGALGLGDVTQQSAHVLSSGDAAMGKVQHYFPKVADARSVILASKTKQAVLLDVSGGLYAWKLEAFDSTGWAAADCSNNTDGEPDVENESN